MTIPEAMEPGSMVAAWSRPTRLSQVTFRAKATLLQLRRAGQDLAGGVQRHRRGDAAAFDTVLALSRTSLWSDRRPEERTMQLGKVQNLRRAARLLDGVVIPAGAVFSFWKQIGRASSHRGFVAGRMLQQGCLVPAMGGGLCQLSNALYEVALQSGAEIVERHPHSRIVPGSAAAFGRDATVAWNYIDLRFRPRQTLLLEARLDRDDLTIALRGQDGAPSVGHGQAADPADGDGHTPHGAASCASCGDTACFRHESRERQSVEGRTAYLLDACWPEFRDFVARQHRAVDVLGIPFDGTRWGLSRYRWETQGFARIGTAPWLTLRRALASRRLQQQGAARLEEQFLWSERLARELAALLTAEVTQVCVAQALLPFLWRDGHLGGRSFSVLATRLPMRHLQQRLDIAAQAWPERASLADFRAPDALVAAELEAFTQADQIVAPHAAVAEQFADKAVRLDWHLPTLPRIVSKGRTRRIAFPGPTIARKGAHELREAARRLDLEVVPLGSALEGPEFWHGVRTGRPGPSGGLVDLPGLAAVVQPALVEEQPRRLLAALAADIPVIATSACGIPARDGLTLVPAGDADALTAALHDLLGADTAA